MKQSLRAVCCAALVTCLCLALAGCGGGGGGGSAPAATGTVSGTVYAPDGATPVQGAIVYVPGTKGSGSRAVTTPEPSICATTTGADGTFVLSGVPTGSVLLKIVKGAWGLSAQVSVTANQIVSLSKNKTTLPSQSGTGGISAPKIAVVTGHYDRIQDVLAKLGMGTLDPATHEVQDGTEKFDIYDGGTGEMVPKPEASTLFSDAAKMATYNIIFINCGADEQQLADEQVKANIRSYVTNGGKLYVTDLAYDFVEQVFPEYIDFYGSDATPAATPETMDSAQVGDSDITTDAEVLDAGLKAWLANFPGALNANGTAHIAGFAGGWAVINGAAANTKAWVRGSVTYTPWDGEGEDYGMAAASKSGDGHRSFARSSNRSRDTEVKLLTVTFSHGSGRVLYTSYHTEHEPSAELRPQERILAYLVFEITAL